MTTEGGGSRPRVGLRETLSLLGRNRAFARLYGAQLISFGGDWFTTVALVGLVHDLTGSPALVALVLAAQTIPFALFSPIGGFLADRFDRRRLMVTSDTARALFALGLLVVDEPGEVWLAFTLVALIGALGAIFEPASSAAVPNLVDPEDLPAANVLVGAAWGAMLAVGGGLGGLVAATLGRDAAFVGDAASFLLSAALLIGIGRRFAEDRDPDEARPGLVAAVTETARYARRDHRVFALLAVKAGFGLSVGVIGLLPLFAVEVFGAGDAGTGILFAVRGIGALVGPFLVHRMTGDLRLLFLAIGVSFAVYGIGYGVFPLMGSLALAAPWVLIAHLGGGAQWTLSTYGLQRIVPDRLRGRVFAFDYGLVTLTVAISLSLTGWAAEHLDIRVVMLGLAAVSLLWAAVWTAMTRDIRRGPGFAARPAEAPPPDPRLLRPPGAPASPEPLRPPETPPPA